MARILSIPFIIASAGAVAPGYFVSGFTHILPYGIDHILFLLALFFLIRKPADLLLQLTLFTLAHSFSLGLSIYGIIAVPDSVVEVAIALSIAFVGAENLFRTKLNAWRSPVVFCSGLVHGLGFAHVFAEAPVGKNDFLAALLSFNIGIEAGQIAVVGVAFLLTAVWRNKDYYHRLVARPASGLICIFGIFWAVERTF